MQVGNILHTYLSMKMEQTVYSEASAYKILAPGNYPEENIYDLKKLSRQAIIRFRIKPGTPCITACKNPRTVKAQKPATVSDAVQIGIPDA